MNLYMSMQKPMTKTSVKALCRLVELLKVGHRVKTWFHVGCHRELWSNITMYFKNGKKKKGGDVCESGGVGNLKGEVLLCGFLFKTGFE